MTKRIFKYPLTIIDRQEIEMPMNTQILTVQLQYGAPVLWALVYDKSAKDKRTIRMYGTGHLVDELPDMTYIGTFQTDGGRFVFHVFEEYL